MRLALFSIVLQLVAGCSWIASDAGSYCNLELVVEDGELVSVSHEYATSESESQKEAELPGL